MAPLPEQLYPKFAVFWEAMDLLYKDFYGELPNTDDATYGAIQCTEQARRPQYFVYDT